MRQSFRAWAENLETFFLEVILEQRRGARAAVVRGILLTLSKVFQVAIKTRRFLYTVRILREFNPGRAGHRHRQPDRGRHRQNACSREICARAARPGTQRGHSLARLSFQAPLRSPGLLLNKLMLRHDTTPPRVVSDGKSLLLDSEMAGDEPYMLASKPERRGGAGG